jgi:hypothetical protein
MTGRAAGFCAGYGIPGFTNAYGGRMGAGFGRGRGRWWRATYSAAGRGSWNPGYTYAPPYSAEQEKEALQNQVRFFEDQLTALQNRIEELEAGDSKGK